MLSVFCFCDPTARQRIKIHLGSQSTQICAQEANRAEGVRWQIVYCSEALLSKPRLAQGVGDVFPASPQQSIQKKAFGDLTEACPLISEVHCAIVRQIVLCLTIYKYS